MKNILEYSYCRNGENWTPAVAEALRSHADGLFFPSGVYHFYPEGTETRYLCITNNDEGLKKQVFRVENRDGFTLRGDHAELVFHGRVLPFWHFKNTLQRLVPDVQFAFRGNIHFNRFVDRNR